jgi:hypothetical protein
MIQSTPVPRYHCTHQPPEQRHENPDKRPRVKLIAPKHPIKSLRELIRLFRECIEDVVESCQTDYVEGSACEPVEDIHWCAFVAMLDLGHLTKERVPELDGTVGWRVRAELRGRMREKGYLERLVHENGSKFTYVSCGECWILCMYELQYGIDFLDEIGRTIIFRYAVRYRLALGCHTQ